MQETTTQRESQYGRFARPAYALAPQRPPPNAHLKSPHHDTLPVVADTTGFQDTQARRPLGRGRDGSIASGTRQGLWWARARSSCWR